MERPVYLDALKRIKDSFSKLVLVKEPIIPWQDENGVRYMGIQEWLKDSGFFPERKAPWCNIIFTMKFSRPLYTDTVANCGMTLYEIISLAIDLAILILTALSYLKDRKS